VSSEVLARKYRPSNFEELVGQESIAQTLSLALDTNRLSHAYLFSGLRGSGKTSTARIFAKALICEKGISSHPCGECQNCQMASHNSHVDIIEMDGASSRKIDDIRDLIEQIKYKPTIARFKIFIIDEVHMLTKEAFNALLKTLEEPPSYVKFILATTDPLKLPATILSRTQHFRFKRIATKKIVEHLIHILNLEQIAFEKEALEILARSGQGSLRDTLTLLEQAIVFSKNYVDVASVTDMLGLVDPKFLEDIFQSIFAKEHTKLIEYVKELEEYEAEMVIDELIIYLKEQMYMQNPLFSTLMLDRFFRILSDAKSLLQINADGSFVLSLIFFKMVEALKIKDIDEMISQFEKNTLPQATPPLSQPQQRVSPTPQKSVPPTIPSQEDRYQILFSKLIANIKDRDYSLGECFEKSVFFISYKENVLTWESCADGECKKSLKHGYGAIKQLVRELFGFSTQIKGIACSKENQPKEVEPIQQQKQEVAQVASMIEENEVGGGASCVASCNGLVDTSKEIDANDILEQPMVKKAIELFEAKKVTVQSKI